MVRLPALRAMAYQSAIENRQSTMKFTRYPKFKGFDVSSINLGELMDSLSDALLDSGYDNDYYWTRQRKQTDNSLDALRAALLQALIEKGLVDELQVREM